MATPIGHSLAGLAVQAAYPAIVAQNRKMLVFLALFMANAPDLDWLPGILVGKPNLYHQTITHSLGFGLLLSSGFAAILGKHGYPFFRVFSLCFFAFLTHLILDFFAYDGRAPYGIPLLWPLVGNYYQSAVSILRGVYHSSSTSASLREVIDGILDLYNVGTIIIEVAIIAPFILLAKFIRKNIKTETFASSGNSTIGQN